MVMPDARVRLPDFTICATGQGEEWLPVEDGAPTIHIHEDFWGMRSLHPLAARYEVETKVDEASRAGEASRDPSGFGWNDMHVCTRPELTFPDVGLTAARAAEILGEHLPRVRRFVATATADSWRTRVATLWGSTRTRRCASVPKKRS
jgi:hypothetical protein